MVRKLITFLTCTRLLIINIFYWKQCIILFISDLKTPVKNIRKYIKKYKNEQHTIIWIFMQMSTYVNIRLSKQICEHTRAHTHARAHTHTCMHHTRTNTLHAHIIAHMHIHITRKLIYYECTQSHSYTHASEQMDAHLCTYVCTRGHTHACAHTFFCIHFIFQISTRSISNYTWKKMPNVRNIEECWKNLLPLKKNPQRSKLFLIVASLFRKF